MRGRGCIVSFFRFLGTVILTDLGIFAAMALVCWVGGWRTARDYANALWLIGAGSVALGALSVIGNWGVTRSFSYQYGQSAGQQDIPGRTRQAMADLGSSYWFSLVTAAVGILSIAFATLIFWGFG
jgi:hypothetical protein